MTSEAFQGSPIETDNKRLCPTPIEFPNFIKRVIAIDLKPCDFGAETLKGVLLNTYRLAGPLPCDSAAAVRPRRRVLVQP